MLHIAVVLCSLTLLTDQKLFFHLGLAATLGGLILTGYAFNLKPHSHAETESAQPAAGAPAHK